MSKTVKSNELFDEYDFSDGVQGKHYKSYKEGVNTIFLKPDIAKVFKNSESVNHALRMLIGLAGNELKEISLKTIKDGNEERSLILI